VPNFLEVYPSVPPLRTSPPLTLAAIPAAGILRSPPSNRAGDALPPASPLIPLLPGKRPFLPPQPSFLDLHLLVSFHVPRSKFLCVATDRAQPAIFYCAGGLHLTPIFLFSLRPLPIVPLLRFFFFLTPPLQPPWPFPSFTVSLPALPTLES